MANQQGWNQQTPAVQSLLRGAMGVRSKVRKAAKRVKRVASKVKKSVKRVKKAKARLVAGSKAAKAYMAKIRKLRK